MKTSYLQEDESGRIFIDDRLHKDCEVLNRCEALTWREAKEAFFAK